MSEDLYLSTAISLYESKVWDEKTFKENVLKHGKEKNLDMNAIEELINRVLPKKDFTIDEKRQFLSNLTFNEGGLKYPNAVEHMADITVEKLFEIEKLSKSHDEILDIINNKNKEKKSVGTIEAEELDLNGLLAKLKSLNPNVDLDIDSINGIILSSKKIEELKLPEGFYYNEQKGITNENNTKSGNYISAKVILVHKVDKNELLDKILNNENDVKKEEKIETSKEEKVSENNREEKQTNKEELYLILIANELLKLNPDVISLDRTNNTIISSKKIEELNLPEGLIYKENGIVDSATGKTISIQLSPSVEKETTKEEEYRLKREEAEKSLNEKKNNVIILPNLADMGLFGDKNNKKESTDEQKKSVVLPNISNMNFSDKEEPTTEEEYEEIHKAVSGSEKDSNVREVNADKERINKLKSKKGKVINYFIKGAIVVTSVALLSPLSAALVVGGYKVFANKIKNGTYHPTGHFGQAIGDVVKKIMYIGMSKEEIEEEKGKNK